MTAGLAGDGPRLEGLVLRTEANFCTVATADGATHLVNYTRRFKTGQRVATTPVVIGDNVTVRLEPAPRTGGVVESILTRRNELYRLAPGRTAIRDVLAANLDSVVIVHSIHAPEFNFGRLDRFLAIAEQAEIPAAIVLNKSDLAPQSEAELLAETYCRAGYQLVISSAKTGERVDAIRAHIRGISALIGPSGVGKSTILNRISPKLHLRTAEVSDATGKGRHTTVVSELMPLGGGDYVADTPGLRSIGLTDLDKYEVASVFRELRPLIGTCRFPDCLHLNEPGCVVRLAVEEGRFSDRRYESYQRLLREVTEGYREEWELTR